MTNKGKRILHAITRLDRGGSATNTLLSCMLLADKGHDVDILHGPSHEPDERLVERAKGSGVGFYEEKSLIRKIHPFRDMIALFRIIGFLRGRHYDIVHAHSSKAGLICRVAAKCAGVRSIVYTPHGHVFYGYFNGLMTALIISVERAAAGITDRIVGLTDAECDEWLRFGIGKKEMYAAIPSGIEFENLKTETQGGSDWRKQLGIRESSMLVGAVGRFIRIKGFKYLIEAVMDQIGKGRDLCLVLAGDGPLLDEYRDMISSSGMQERFHIIQWQENVGAILKDLDVFVMPSLNEGMGRVLVEAMYFEKPVIATRVGGVSSVISEKSGILVEPGSSTALSDALEKVLNDKERAVEMGREGRARAVAEYSAQVMADKLEALYGELIDNKENLSEKGIS